MKLTSYLIRLFRPRMCSQTSQSGSRRMLQIGQKLGFWNTEQFPLIDQSKKKKKVKYVTLLGVCERTHCCDCVQRKKFQSTDDKGETRAELPHKEHIKTI